VAYTGVHCEGGNISKIVQDRVVVTGSIASSATRRYLSDSEADLEVFRPAGATRCTDLSEIWLGGADL